MTRRPDDQIVRAEYAALVREAMGGSRAAMERLLMRAQEVAYRFSILVCGHPEDAEDVMQEALLNTFQYVRRIDDPSAFRTWLYATVRNACLMKRRRRVGEPAGFVPIDVHAGDDPSLAAIADRAMPVDEQLVQAAVGARLRAALDRLPAAYRMIVVLREMEGLSTREVAAITGYSEANVKQRLHRARVRLRQHLENV
ncbi:MAG: sigma-70 family RNA polymerase sigma factor [Acidobacteriaceae bacterium]|nr:sigma-70 family RNA polymerase sigma factor [Acidobacteriaceae bacterium]